MENNTKTYKIGVTMTLYKEVEVEATSLQNAINLTREDVQDDTIQFDVNADCINVNYEKV